MNFHNLTVDCNPQTTILFNAMMRKAENEALAKRRLTKRQKATRRVSDTIALHLKRCASTLTPAQREHDAAGNRIAIQNVCKLVTIDREVTGNMNRYNGVKLRQIRKTGQSRECARRLRRMQEAA